MRGKGILTGKTYSVIAQGIREIQDPQQRQAAADHFARFFHARSKAFDPQAWFQSTGGLINRKAAA